MQIETASPARLLVMLYDGALRRLSDAAESMKAGDFVAGHDSLVKVQDILLELMVSLDFERAASWPGTCIVSTITCISRSCRPTSGGGSSRSRT